MSLNLRLRHAHSHLSQHALGPVLSTRRRGKREGRRGERERLRGRPEGFRSVRTFHHERVLGTGREGHGVRSEEVDWEVELAFVIGKKGKHIKEEDALGHVAGFTVANDVSARDWQMKRNGKQWLLGKTFDTFCPLGPALVTTAALKDVHNLGIRCLVNGDVVQESNTDQLIFKTEKLVAWVSQFVTLYPGDVFLTGTPPGVGVFRKPPVFLKKGDVVECRIEEIGSIRNAVV